MQTFGTRQTIQFKPQPLKVIAIGDSLIYGYGDTEGGGWVERLKRRWMYGEREHVLYNLGIRGDRTSQVKERLALEYKYRGELRNRYPDRIIISVGVNDSPRLGRKAGRNLTDYDQFCQDIEELLNQAQQLCPVFFVGMIPVDEDKMPFLDCFYYNRRDQYRYKEATKQVCAERNIPYLDTFDLWTSRGENWIKNHLCEDGLHPNVQGYQSLYDDITQWQPLQLMIEKYPS